ncbi:MASE2 domain-containing protein, partial [Klebsiella quasipneumoniae]|uniref:MASE2 domain-containing protein n=1 Tax=Klebsiella quasipneumoniae TaxID=1463165 RepID=UPI0027309D95
RIYRPRIIGTAMCCISVIAALSPLAKPDWVWALLFINGFVWPHLAYQLATRSKFPYDAEQRNLVWDALFSGFWVATLGGSSQCALRLCSAYG